MAGGTGLAVAVLWLVAALGALGPAAASPAPARRCPARYVNICGVYGLTCNRMTYIMKAYGYAAAYSRTLVLPDVFFETFDRAALAAGPVCVITQTQYEALHIPREHEGCIQGTTHRPCCQYRSDAANRTTMVVHARSTFNSMVFLTEDRLMRTPCMAAFLRPNDAIEREVQAVLEGLPPRFLGVHLRRCTYSPDRKSCIDALAPLAHYVTKALGRPWRPLPTGDECVMPPRYVNCFRNDSRPFFVGTDHFNKTATDLLKAAGAVLYRPTAATRSIALWVDIFVLTRATEFLGNPLSSFSAFICSMRRTHGRRCINLPPEAYPGQCVLWPDNFLPFHNHRMRRKRQGQPLPQLALPACSAPYANATQ